MSIKLDDTLQLAVCPQLQQGLHHLVVAQPCRSSTTNISFKLNAQQYCVDPDQHWQDPDP